MEVMELQEQVELQVLQGQVELQVYQVRMVLILQVLSTLTTQRQQHRILDQVSSD